jgi:hypothetical protein
MIGIIRDDEFAWVCQKDDGSIVEFDEYDLKMKPQIQRLVFPSLSHYLLIFADLFRISQSMRTAQILSVKVADDFF